MYQLTINSLTQEQFLAEYWQKKPLLIKQGFKDFADPIEPEELAGLAMEESIESRIVTNHSDDWQAYHGPFEDFSLLRFTLFAVYVASSTNLVAYLQGQRMAMVKNKFYWLSWQFY